MSVHKRGACAIGDTSYWWYWKKYLASLLNGSQVVKVTEERNVTFYFLS